MERSYGSADCSRSERHEQRVPNAALILSDSVATREESRIHIKSGWPEPVAPGLDSLNSAGEDSIRSPRTVSTFAARIH
jgi:hypothetical protein